MADLIPSIVNDPSGSTRAYQVEVAALVVPFATDLTTDSFVLSGKIGRVAAQLKNNGPTNALDNLVIQGRTTPNGAWFTYITNAEIAAATPIAGRLLQVVGGVATLAAGATGAVIFDVVGLDAIRFLISSATAGVTVDLNLCGGTGQT